MGDKKCATCMNWQRDGADGICRAYPPTPATLSANNSYTVFWPRTRADDWCAEHEIECSDPKPE